MKVLLTHERFLPDFGGGGEYIAYETAAHLMRRGIEVRVLTTGDPACRSYRGVPTVRLPVHRYRLNGAARAVARVARDADLIHTFNYHAALPSLAAARWIGKPVVCQVLGLFGDAWREMRGRIAGTAFIAWERLVVTRGYDRTIFLSDYSREIGVSLGADPRRAVSNPPGVAPEYAPAPAKEDVVLFAGKLERRKGVDELLAVARRLPQVRFRVLGWGPEEERMRREAPGNVELCGFTQGRQLHDAFARARIFFFPSRAETFGLVVAEAMASGCAIVSTVPLDYQGALVRVGDVEGMAAAVLRLWNDRQAADAARRRNVELAGRYTWERYTDALLDTYARVLREQPLSGRACAREHHVS